MCNFQVFSDVYAVLNKKWKESHHDRLCEILAYVEREYSVEISFVKGAYQFRGTLKALSSVFHSLKHRSDSSQVVFGSDDDAKVHAKQCGELLSDEECGLTSDEAYCGDRSRSEEKVRRPTFASDMPPGKEELASDKDLKSSTCEDKAVDQKTQPESDQVEQAENLPEITAADHHFVSDKPTMILSNEPSIDKCDSANPVEAAAHEEHCRNGGNSVDQHYEEDIVPLTDASLSSPSVTREDVQITENFQASHKSTVLNALEKPDTTQSEQMTTLSLVSAYKTESTQIVKHEQEASEAKFLLNCPDTASAGECVSDFPTPSRFSHASAASAFGKDSGRKLLASMKYLIYERNSTDLLSTSREQRGLEVSHSSIPPYQSAGASAGINSRNVPQQGIGTEISSTTPGSSVSASDKDFKNKSRGELSADSAGTKLTKVLIYERCSTDSSTTC